MMTISPKVWNKMGCINDPAWTPTTQRVCGWGGGLNQLPISSSLGLDQKCMKSKLKSNIIEESQQWKLWGRDYPPVWQTENISDDQFFISLIPDEQVLPVAMLLIKSWIFQSFFQGPHSYIVRTFFSWSICLWAFSHPVLIGWDKSCDIRNIDDIIVHFQQGHILQQV